MAIGNNMNQTIESKYLIKCKWLVKIPYLIGILYMNAIKWRRPVFIHQKYLQNYIFYFGKIAIYIVDINFVLGK